MKLYFSVNGTTQIIGEAGGKLGRAEGLAVHVADPSVSSQHAEFSWDGEKWWILPLSERNPILRDGKRLPIAKVPLGQMGTLQFGVILIPFYVEGYEPKGDAAPPPAWQVLRIKDPPSNLPPRNPPVVDLSLNQAPTLVQTRSRGSVPQTIVSQPISTGPTAPLAAAQAMQAPYTAPAVHAQYVPPQPAVHTPPPSPVAYPPIRQPLLETTVGYSGRVTPICTPVPPPAALLTPALEEPTPAPAGVLESSRSRHGELLRQAGILLGLLALICAVGFCVGMWFWEGA